MESLHILILFVIGFIGSFLSGMLGIGGAIVKYPMLLYIPPLLGFSAFTAHEVTGISALDVLFVSVAGVLAYKRSGYLNKQLITVMGSFVLIGSTIGSFGSQLLTENLINAVYGVLALSAAVMMVMPKKGVDDQLLEEVTFHKPLAAGLAFFVGLGSGIVGAGGGFLLIPIMLLILKIPTRMTIASSLAITFISSLGGSIGKISTGQVDYISACIIIIAGLVAAPLGAKISQKLNTQTLHTLLAILLCITAIKIWIDIL